jgi:hypothetical protein
VNGAVIYTAVQNGPLTSDYCARFVATWMEYPPGYPCDLFVSCNGGALLTEQRIMFLPMSARMFPRANTPGLDLDGYFDAVRGPCKDYDAVLCLGESIYFTREGWLLRLVEAWKKHGPGFYGPFGSNNSAPHLQTSAFFCSPETLRSYPVRPKNRAERFEFEHGKRPLWRRCTWNNMPVRCVTWDGEWEPRLWRMPQNLLWRGDQSNLLMMNNHALGWENANANTKRQWSAKADVPFQ